MPTYICQNVTLKPGKKYQLSYSLYCDPRLQKMKVFATINNYTASTMYIQISNTSLSKIDYLYAQQIENQICFHETHEIVSIYQGQNLDRFGGLIDNISLLEAYYYEITFKITIFQNLSIIILSSQLQSQSLEYLQEFLVQYKLQVGIYGFTEQYHYSQRFFVQIHPIEGLWLGDIKFTLTNSSMINQMFYFNVTVQKRGQYFHALNQNGQLVLQTLQKLIDIIVGPFAYFSNSIRYVLCSYIVITMINFRTMSLYYIFLKISVVPQFCRQVYYRLLEIFLNQQTLLNYLERFGILEKEYVLFQLEQILVKQTVPYVKQKDSKYFGFFGFSSLLVRNNIDFFFAQALLLVKLLIIQAARRIFFKQKRVKRNILNCLTIVLIGEFMCSIPAFVISAFHSQINSLNNYFQKIEKILQNCILFMCFGSTTLYLIVIKQKQENRAEKSKKDQKIICKNIKQNVSIKKKIRPYYKLSNFIMFIQFSYLLCIQDLISFFVLTYIVLFLQITLYIKNDSLLSPAKKIINILVNVLWMVHHTIFLLFYLISTQSGTKVQLHRKYKQEIIILGLMAIFTVVLGWFLEIIRFIIQFVYWTKELVSYCKRKEKEKIHIKKRQVAQSFRDERLLVVEQLEILDSPTKKGRVVQKWSKNDLLMKKGTKDFIIQGKKQQKIQENVKKNKVIFCVFDNKIY